MRLPGLTALFLFISGALFAADKSNLQLFFSQLSKLEFEKAKQLAGQEPDKQLGEELLRLVVILTNAGQTDKPNLDFIVENQEDYISTIIKSLEKGYVSLYYDEIKGDAYREFYSAYQIAKAKEDRILVKASLLAVLEYYRNEYAENSDARLPYLKHFESLELDTIDKVWLAVYKSEFYSRKMTDLDSNFFALENDLNTAEMSLRPESPMLAYVFYEKGINLELRRLRDKDSIYFNKAFNQTKDYNFLWFVRFSCLMKLTMIAVQNDQFDKAQKFLERARMEVSPANESKTSYWLNLYGAEFLKAAHRSDSAYVLLKKAFAQDFQRNFRQNSLEINRLNVELETQEKENANLKLTQEKNWLVSGIAGLGLLGIVGFLVYRNQRAKTNLELQQKEVHSMKLEKQLKDQEITGIDQMIEAQEKERQRIANELHDNLGSHLASIKLYFQNLQQKVNDPAQNELFQKTDQLLEETYQQVRTLAHARNVGVNSKDGLMPAVRSFAAKISGANRLAVDVEEHGMNTRLENSLEILLFRIIQELTTNAIKHAKASELTISLTRHDDSINLMVEDNGAGFEIAQIKPRDTMGLHTIQKRVENLGGRVAIDSIIGSGTTVIIDLPI
jgi:signal transduction histidine kinase